MCQDINHTLTMKCHAMLISIMHTMICSFETVVMGFADPTTCVYLQFVTAAVHAAEEQREAVSKQGASEL